MFLCMSNFDIQEENVLFLKDYFSHNDIETSKEEREGSPDEIDIEPISEDEEEQAQAQDNIDGAADAGSPTLPSDEGNTQIRASIRSRKRPRALDSYELYD